MTLATQAQADAFAMHMCAAFHARLIRKDMAIEMQVVAALFDALRAFGVQLPVGGDFLDHYATTLGPLIYMPPGFSPDQQIETLAHECQHVHQFWSGRPTQTGLPNAFGMGWLYLTEPEARVRYEVEAYRTGLEVAYGRTRAVPPLAQLAMPLEGGYALDDAAHQLAAALLERAATSVAAGVVSTAAGAEALRWLAQNTPELLAPAP